MVCLLFVVLWLFWGCFGPARNDDDDERNDETIENMTSHMVGTTVISGASDQR